jgi:RNA polymerase sigma-B factor
VGGVDGKANRPPPLLDPQEERRLFELLRRDGDQAARRRLIEAFLPLAERLARRYSHTPEPMEDLVQVASVGLVSAVERFDPERGSPFSSFAVPTILGELKRHFRDRSWSVHVPRPVQERALKAERAVRDLTGRYGRSPTVPELAVYLDLSVEEVVEALGAASAHDSASLDAPRSDDPDAGTHLDALGVEEGHYEVVEYGASISAALANLPERDRRALHLRFVEDMTQSQIAERLGTSQMQVSRILRGALAVLRVAAGEPENAGAEPPTRRRRSR